MVSGARETVAVLRAAYIERREPFTHYGVLGVLRAARERDIVRGYRRRAKRLHPDASRDPGTAERFQRATVAYDTLLDRARRAAYDAALQESGRRPRPDSRTPTVLRREIEDALIGGSVALAWVGGCYIVAMLVGLA